MILLTLLLSIALAQENKVYVMSADAPTQAFKAQLEVDASSKSYIDFFLNERPQWSKVQKLQQAFEAAQKGYLNQPLSESKELFENVADLRFDEDWDPPQIKIIHYSLLRLAQHAHDHERWMEEAIRWNSDMEPDPDLFPPTFIAEWKNQKQKIKMNTWDLSSFKQSGEAFIVNGEWIPAQDFIVRPEGVYRLTVVSNRFLPVSIKGTYKDFIAKISSRSPFIRGNCSNPEWNSQVQGQNLKAFFSTECQVVLRDKKKNLDLTPTIAQTPFAETTPYPKSSSLLESKWFWIGAAVVGGFLVYNQTKPKKGGTEPSTREGF